MLTKHPTCWCPPNQDANVFDALIVDGAGCDAIGAAKEDMLTPNSMDMHDVIKPTTLRTSARAPKAAVGR